MDTKNVIAAISLSAAVIIIYALFFGPSPEQLKRAQEQKNQITQSSETPSLDVGQTTSKFIEQTLQTLLSQTLWTNSRKFTVKLYLPNFVGFVSQSLCQTL